MRSILVCSLTTIFQSKPWHSVALSYFGKMCDSTPKQQHLSGCECSVCESGEFCRDLLPHPLATFAPPCKLLGTSSPLKSCCVATCPEVSVFLQCRQPFCGDEVLLICAMLKVTKF